MSMRKLFALKREGVAESIEVNSLKYSSRLDSNSIRLIRFEPGPPPAAHSYQRLIRRVPGVDDWISKQLWLKIQDFAIDSAPPYHALSYTWGAPDNADPNYDLGHRRPIIINGQNFYALPNLRDALHCLRTMSLSEWHWVDAICINQRDLVERQAQVSAMGRIYKSAEQVNVWVGVSLGYPPETMELIRRLGGMAMDELLNIAKQGNSNLFRGPETQTHLTRLGLPALTEHIWTSLTRFFDRRWFSRVWIVQEVALAKTCVLLWDGQAVPWQEVAHCSNFLVSSDLGATLGENQSLSRRSSSVAVSQVGTLANTVNIFRHQCLESKVLPSDPSPDALALEYITGYKEEDAKTSHFLLLCALTARGFNATDNRDKVYAFLGLVHHMAELNGWERLNMSPDYSNESSVASVFTTVASYIMTECNHIGLITVVTDSGATEVATLADLPSWVPDLSRMWPSGMMMRFRSRRVRAFDCCGVQGARSQNFRIVGSALHTSATCLGALRKLGDPLLEWFAAGAFERTADLILSCAMVYPFTGQDRSEVFWRTLLCDTDDWNHPAPPALQEHFHYWLKFLVIKGCALLDAKGGDVQAHLQSQAFFRQLAEEDRSGIIPNVAEIEAGCKKLGFWPKVTRRADREDSQAYNLELEQRMGPFQTAVFTLAPYRRLFMIEDGHMGLGPQSAEIDDTVWIIQGCPTAMILRKLDAPVGCYKLIGETYVHGSMHGEAVNEKTKWEEITLL